MVSLVAPSSGELTAQACKAAAATAIRSYLPAAHCTASLETSALYQAEHGPFPLLFKIKEFLTRWG